MKKRDRDLVCMLLLGVLLSACAGPQAPQAPAATATPPNIPPETATLELCVGSARSFTIEKEPEPYTIQVSRSGGLFIVTMETGEENFNVSISNRTHACTVSWDDKKLSVRKIGEDFWLLYPLGWEVVESES